MCEQRCEGPSSAAAISGIFDLRPLQHSFLQTYLNLTDLEIEQLSLSGNIRRISGKLILAVGRDENSKFRRQSKDFWTEWRAAGNVGRHACLPDRNHLTILSELSDPCGTVLQDVCEQMGLQEGGE